MLGSPIYMVPTLNYLYVSIFNLTKRNTIGARNIARRRIQHKGRRMVSGGDNIRVPGGQLPS